MIAPPLYYFVPMEVAIEKAEALIEAHRYIRTFRDQIVVIKVGGSIQDDEARMRALLADVSFMSTVGMRPVIVHGGGKSITEATAKAGIQARFVQGRRYTDRQTLEIAEQILCQDVNASLVQYLNDAGALAIGLHSMGSSVLFGKKTIVRGADGEPLDVGYVGEITDVNTTLLHALCEDGYVPVLAPIAVSREPLDGGVWKLNVNADTAAGTVAAALKAEKLVMCSDTHGIRTDPKDAESYASTLTRGDIDRMVRTGVIGEGMLPKVDACLTALRAGVKKSHIIDGRIPHSLLLEIYTDAGIGTQITLE
jgi:acetylglutamate kinase